MVIFFEMVKVLSSIATLCIAFAALKNWRRQDKAKRETEFLDSLIEAAHAYIAQMPRPTSQVEFAKIGAVSHAPVGASASRHEKAVKGAPFYIEKYGEVESRKLGESLNALEPAVIKLKGLAVKGQVFRFPGYADCFSAVELLAWQFDRLRGFQSVLASTSVNWEHPLVMKNLEDYMALEPDEIRAHLSSNNMALIKFVSGIYARIYPEKRRFSPM